MNRVTEQRGMLTLEIAGPRRAVRLHRAHGDREGVRGRDSEISLVTPDLSLARNGFRVGGRTPIAVEGQTYGLIAVLDRIDPDVRGWGVPARYNCHCIRCGEIFAAKGSDVVHRRIRLCCQPRRQS